MADSTSFHVFGTLLHDGTSFHVFGTLLHRWHQFSCFQYSAPLMAPVFMFSVLCSTDGTSFHVFGIRILITSYLMVAKIRLLVPLTRRQ